MYSAVLRSLKCNGDAADCSLSIASTVVSLESFVRCFHDAESKFADVCSDVVNPAPFSPSCRSRVVQSGIELSMVWVDPWVGFGWVTRNGHPWTTLVWHRRFDVVVGVTRFHQVSHQSAALRQTEIPARSRRRTSRQICVTTRAATASSDALRAANSTSSRSSSSSSSPSPSQSDIIRGFKGRGQVGHAPRTCPPPTSFTRGHLAPLECKKTY